MFKKLNVCVMLSAVCLFFMPLKRILSVGPELQHGDLSFVRAPKETVLLWKH